MPAYTFEALDAQGATQKGLIDADTARSARSMLRARALVPLLQRALDVTAAAELPAITPDGPCYLQFSPGLLLYLGGDFRFKVI